MAKSIALISALLLIASATNLPAEPSDTVYARAYAVNIRSGPGLEYEIVGVSYINEPLEVATREKEWTEIIKGDTLDGWMFNQFLTDNPVPVQKRDEIYYFEAPINQKLEVIRRMAAQNSGPGFDFLRKVALNHADYQLELEIDRALLPAIFRAWNQNNIVESIPVLSIVMERGISGEISGSPQAIWNIKAAAKEALMELVRK